MSKTIWKFVLQPKCEIEMPEGAELLTVQEQGDDICLWAVVEPNSPRVTRKFVGFGTGHPIPGDLQLKFVGTALLHGGALVFHIFEIV